MTTIRRLHRLRGAAEVLGAFAAFLFIAAPAFPQGTEGTAGGSLGLSSLVPWAVGVIGVLVLYILKLTRELEKDFTAVKAAHTAQIDELERGRVRNQARLDLQEERIASMPREIELARQKVAAETGDIVTRQDGRFVALVDGLSMRIQFLEQAAMRGRRKEPAS